MPHGRWKIPTGKRLVRLTVVAAKERGFFGEETALTLII